MSVPDLQRPSAALAVMLALSSVAAHAWMLAAMPTAPVLHVVVLAMATGCLWCGVRVLRAPRVREWAATAVMGAAMIGMHLVLGGSHAVAHGASMSDMTGNAMTGSAMTGGATRTAADPMTVSMMLALAEVLVAVAVLWRLTAARHP